MGYIFAVDDSSPTLHILKTAIESAYPQHTVLTHVCDTEADVARTGTAFIQAIHAAGRQETPPNANIREKNQFFNNGFIDGIIMDYNLGSYVQNGATLIAAIKKVAELRARMYEDFRRQFVEKGIKTVLLTTSVAEVRPDEKRKFDAVIEKGSLDASTIDSVVQSIFG